MSDPPILPVMLAGSAAGILSAALLWAYSIYAPRCQFWAPVIRSLPQREAVALTFEGLDVEVTPRILEVLAAEKVPAVFFVAGRDAAEHPDLIRGIRAAGHVLGNGTYEGRFELRRSRAAWADDLGRTQQILAELGGQPVLLLRPPGGFKSRGLAAAARELRLPIIGWSVRGPEGKPAERLGARVIKSTTGHDIVALRADERGTAESLPAIIAGVREKKLQFVPLVETLVAASEAYAKGKERTRERAEGG